MCQIRENSCNNVAPTLPLLESMAVIAEYRENPQHKTSLRHHTDLIFKASDRDLSFEQDKKDVKKSYGVVSKALGSKKI